MGDAQGEEIRAAEAIPRYQPPDEMTMHDFMNPPRRPRQPSLVLPPGHANFKPDFAMLRDLPTFKGGLHENPYHHLGEFEMIVSTIRRDLNPDTVKMTIFPFSLKDRAKVWLTSARPSSFTT